MEISRLVDETVSTWHQERPDLEFEHMGSMLRLNALVQAASSKIRIITEAHGLTMGEFDVLATLRRHGVDSKLTPSYIAEVAMVSPSGLTHRLARLEKSGHITRIADNADRRSSFITITSSGAALAELIIEVIVEQSNQLYGSLSVENLESFTRVVSILTAHVESDVASHPEKVDQ